MHDHARTHCPELLAQAAETLGSDPFEHMHEGTLYLQPAIYCGGLAHWREAGEPSADLAAGHSLGELTALTAAGYMKPEEGMRLVLARAAAMHRAGSLSEPGGMLAVLGDRDQALKLCSEYHLTVAADNEPGQLVLSGPLDVLQQARTAARELGLKAVRLRVPLALHSPAMEPAIAPFVEALREVRFRRPRMTVVANVTASPFVDVAMELTQAICSRVRWRESVLAMHRCGVTQYDEMGSQRILTGLVERTLAAEARA